MKSVEVIVWGLARMSSLMARILDEREGVGVVGAVDSAPSKTGRTLGELFRTVKIRNVTVAGNARHAPAGGGDMMLLAISSFICDAVTPMQMIMESGKDVIIIEWAWPRVRDPEAARRADSPVKEGRVSVLDTGVNPGFVPDTIIIALIGVCRGVRSMAARRVNDLSPLRSGGHGNPRSWKKPGGFPTRQGKRLHQGTCGLCPVSGNDRIFHRSED